MPKLKMASIMMPEHYVRGKISGPNVKDLFDVVCKANGVEDWKKLIGKKLLWPFHSPIEVATNPVPTEGKALKGKGVKETGKGKKRGKVFKPYEIMDGVTRWTIWRRLKQKKIEANVKNIQAPAARYKEQYDTNAAHGMRLDKDQRDNYIRTAHTVFKVSLSNLAKETGLDRSSITRIIAEKQRGPKAKKARKEKEGFGRDLPIGDMTVLGFLERLQLLLNAYPKLAEPLTAYLTENITVAGRSKIGGVASRLHSIATVFETALRTVPAKSKVEPTQSTTQAHTS